MSLCSFLSKKSKEKDENRHPKHMLRSDKSECKNSIKLSEISLINIDASQSRSKMRKKNFPFSNLKQGDLVFAKDTDRSFKQATILKKINNNYLVKFKSGIEQLVESTKLRVQTCSSINTKIDSPANRTLPTISKTSNVKRSNKLYSGSKSLRIKNIHQKSTIILPTSKPTSPNRFHEKTQNSELKLSPPNTSINHEINEENISIPSDKILRNGKIIVEYEYKPKIVEISEIVEDLVKIEDVISSKETEVPVNCACGSNERQGDMIKCTLCETMQHSHCLGPQLNIYSCYICAKSALNIDDQFYYNFFMVQNGMFPDKILNKKCEITPDKSALFRTINKCIEDAEQGNQINENIDELESRILKSYPVPISHVEEINVSKNAEQLFTYLTNYVNTPS